ncbi:hypothetical protein DAEQUDRAFT_760578 [Daedalea quercina L-15889]|uniref:F-box domain-containing protein n=1 Tax=Daedalea quercina L-15889 TaxID=1314783 RepID=A0A165KKD8_9APHY|nr:hypothetical protein DAEQUDRAFT_760578 [Daedalea quercina L-15889]
MTSTLKLVYVDTISVIATFPQELVNYTMDFLWDELLQLVKCSLVCHSWYDAAKWHLPARDVIIKDRQTLGSFVHILMLKQNKGYANTVDSLMVIDQPTVSIVHSLPARIRGHLLPKLQRLAFCHLTWADTSPHSSFFIHLSSFQSVKDVTLTGCSFHSSEQVLRILKALLNLERLKLTGVTVDSPQSATLACIPGLQTNHKLKTIIQQCNITQKVHGLYVYQGLLNILISYPALQSLEVGLGCFLSWYQLQQFLCALHKVPEVTLSGEPSWNPICQINSNEAYVIANPLIRSDYCQITLSVSSAVVIQFLYLARYHHNEFHWLFINFEDAPSSVLQALMMNTLQTSELSQVHFGWDCDNVLGTNHFPAYLSAYNVGLHAKFRNVELTTHWFQEILFELLPNVRSTLPWIEEFHIQMQFHLWQQTLLQTFMTCSVITHFNYLDMKVWC